MSDRNIEDCLAELGDRFMGLWRYRNYEQRGKEYYATILYNDHHWDTKGSLTALEAVMEATDLLKKLRKDNPIQL